MSGLRHFPRRRLLRSSRRRQLVLESLEDRRVLSVFTVDWAGDEPDWLPGDGKALTISKTTTLRAAIMEANASVGKDTIEFNIPGAGPHVIKPATRLPVMFDAITIDGYSQPGASPTSKTLQEGNNAIIKIELDGSLLPIGTNGLEIFGGQSDVRGLAIHSFYGRPIANQEFLGTTIVAENGMGIWLWAGGNSQIVGNFLGATASGQVPTYPLPAGIATAGIMVGSYDNVIQENLVVGNHGPGVVLGSKFGDVLATKVYGNKLYGNYIGMKQNGQTPLPNDTGVLVCWGAHDNEIGGGSANFGNLISGNSGVGVSIVGVGPDGIYFGGNVVQRNLIGTDRTGKLIDPDKKPKTGDEIGNRHVGIQVDRSPNNVIGGTTADAGNVISGNLGGVLVVEPQSEGNTIRNNKIGTDVEGKVALPNALNGIDIHGAPRNTIKSNLIAGNSGSGIYVEGPSATANLMETNLIGTDASGTKVLGNHFGGIDIIKAAENVVFRNTISGSPSFGVGVTISGAEAKKNRISENRIGTDATGQQDLGNTGAGVAIVGGSENLVNGNIISGNDLCGILVDGSTAKKNDVYGNFIGTDVTGTRQLKNGLDGIWIQNASENWIGGFDPTARNIIAGNDRDGIRISGKTAKGNKVTGNSIGTDVTGMKPLPNGGAGVYVENAPENIIGGETSDRRNTISGNLGCGVVIFGADALKNKIQGNYIGTNKDGTGIDLGNADDGVLIDKAAENLIGGATSQTGDAPGNVISGNWLYGIRIKGSGAHDNEVHGNAIGRDGGYNVLPNAVGGVLVDNAPTNIIGEKPHPFSGEISDTGAWNVISGNGGDAVRVEGPQAVDNVIRRNSIYENKGLGINLVGDEHLRVKQDGVTPNDPGDGDNGANMLMNFPVGVTSWFNGVDTYISGVLDTLNPQDAAVDIYANQKVGATGFGEGQMYVGTTTPDRQGNFVFQVSGALLPEYRFLSATATSGEGLLSTSEFSPVYRGYGPQSTIDSDGDHLPDEWEIEGVDFDGDGRPDLDLAAAQYGADPNRKDIFIEVDYMEDATRSYRPETGFEWLVQQAFLSAPVDGVKGIAIHIDVDEAVPLISNIVWKRAAAAGTGTQDDYDDIKLGNPENPTGTGPHDAHFGTVDERNMRDPSTASDDLARNILGAKRLVYRYCIFGNYFLRTKADGTTEPTKSGGVSEPLGNDFIVMLGPNSAKAPGSSTITDWLPYQAATFMHELGHTMGLGHGGPWPRTSWDAWASDVQSNLNYKPNFLTIMNYAFSFPDPVPDRPMDFSRSALQRLDEAYLFEKDGLLASPAASSFWPRTAYTVDDTGKKFKVVPTNGTIDWNNDGAISASAVDAGINDYGDDPGFVVTKNEVLMGAEEWSQLFFHFRASPRFVEGAHGDELPTPDPSREDAAEMARYTDFDGDGLMTPDDNAPAVFNPDQANRDSDGVGDAGELAGFTISRGAAVGGDELVGTVTLLLPAPSGGTFVRLYSSGMSVATVPRDVAIPEGARSATFAITTSQLTRKITPVTILADFFQQYLMAEFTVTPAPADADLSLTMAGAPDPVGLGGIVSYTIDVTNDGPESVTGVTLTDVLPDGAVFKSATGSVSEQVPGPGLRVRFDYTYDTSGVFDTQDKKDLLQLAGDILMSAMGDDLAAIVPEGSNTWTAIFDNPATGAEERIIDLVVPANEIIVYVGARDLGDTGTGVREGALAGPGSLSVSGSAEFAQTVTTRGEHGADGTAPTDFGPWGGAITFNTNPAVTFSYDDEVEPGAFDLFTVALHEMVHVLGLGTAESWETYVDAALGTFRGPASRLEYDAGGDVPLDLDTLGHWREGITEAGEPVLMDPLAPNAIRIWYPTALDWAGLADVGWNIDGLLTVERPITFTEMAGSVIGDIGVLEPGQSVTITLEVQPTLAGAIHNVATVTGYCDDPDLSNNTVGSLGTVTPLVLMVNTTDDVDDGVVDATHTSLREAINAANHALGVNTISFNIPGSGPHSIQPTSPLPVITDPVIIDGATEPDYAGTPVIELSGTLASIGGNGLMITAGGSTVRGLVINHFQSDGLLETGNAILLKQGDGNTIEGCYLGTDISGTLALANEGAGVLVLESDNNRIGGVALGAGNVISGNTQWGVFLGPEVRGHVIAGNLIGTDVDGVAALGNGQSGIELYRATSNTVGGRTPEARNVISGNGTGITIKNVTGVGGTTNRIEGNYIGTNAAGDAAVGNGTGIQISDFLSTFTGRDAIGGTAPGAGNVISGNLGTGVQVVGTASIHVPEETYPIQGNLIGVAADGVMPLGNGGDGIQLSGSAAVGGFEPGAANTIAYNDGDGVALQLGRDIGTFLVGQNETAYLRGNSIHSNDGLGIDVDSDGVNAPISGTDRSLNFYPNYPVLTRAFSGNGTTTVEGTVAAINLPLQGWRFDNEMDFYASPIADPSGYGEGMLYLGSHAVFTYDTAYFSATLPVEVPAGYVVTATNTRWNMISEFSAALAVQPDADGDGVLNAVEDAGPNGGDANDDGVLDRLQNEVASLPNMVDGQYVILEVEPGGILRDVRAWENPSPYDAPPGVTFPHGFFTCQAASGLVTLRPPAGQSLDTVYNHGPTTDRPFDHWYQFLYDGFSGAEVFSDRAVLHTSRLEAGTRIGPAVIDSGAGVTIVVNSIDDDDDGQPDNEHTTLREAIYRANFLPGRDTIAFAIPGPGPHTIRPTSSPNPINPNLTRVSLPWITDPVIIDGYTQPGATPATGDTPATLMIELDGSLAVGGADGLALRGGNSVVRGLVINRFGTDNYGYRGGSQIAIYTDYGNPLPGNNIIEGNYIGTDVTGSSTYRLDEGWWTAQRYGVNIGYSSHNIIGGATPAARNVIAGQSSHGVSVWAATHDPTPSTGNQILGNYIGVDASGSQHLGNLWGIVVAGAAATMIGGVEPGAGNVVSGNDGGVQSEMWDFLSPGTIIQGNRIGTDATGTNPLGNGSGITLAGWNSIVGGDNPAAANVISANAGDGIYIWGSGDAPQPQPAGRNTVQGNFIGTDINGTLDLGNAGHGISIRSSKENWIGGLTKGSGNVIAFNAGTGITVAGLPYEQGPAYGNGIQMNSIFANGGLGIDLVRSDIRNTEPDGVTPNDPGDGFFVQPQLVDAWVDFDGTISWVHVTVSGLPNWLVGVTLHFTTAPGTYFSEVYTDENGMGELVQGFGGTAAPVELDHVEVYDLGWFAMANMLQNYPNITSVTLSGDTTIAGVLDSTPDKIFRVEFFDNSQADASGHGEGQEFLGVIDVTTDATGMANFTWTMPERLPLDHVITATATDPDGNTSEFSLAVAPTVAAWDFGDASDPTFPTLLNSNGARHALGSQLYLGSGVDAEEDGQPSEWADGDDLTGTYDEDGVMFLSPLVPGQWAAVQVTASARGRLDAWIDFADNGTWSEVEDRVYAGATLLPGPNTLFLEVPASASAGAMVFARFRFSSEGDLDFDGPAVDGEVEDYVVVVSVSPTGNLPPTAVDDEATTSVSVPIAIDVTNNDVDPEGQLDPHAVTVTAVPTSGSVFVDPASGVITYIPSTGFTGDDEFSYRVSDTEGLVDTARVLVHVLPGNQPPVAVNDTATTDEEVPVVIDVLANDTDADDGLDPATVTIVVPPAHGTVQVDAQSGAVTYTPEADYSGADRLAYAVSDTQGATARAVVEISVQPVSDPPVAQDDLAQTDQDMPVVLDVLANDTDADGDLDPTTMSVVEAPQHGLAVVDPITGQITYTPSIGFTGMDTVVYRVLDATENAAAATVRIEVLPTSSPPDAADDAAETPEDTPVSIDVVANDTDADGDLDPDSVQILVGPLHGSAQVDPDTGHIVFTPAADFIGLELLWYEIRDARGQSDMGLVHITVTPVNDPPEAHDDVAIILQDTPTDLYVLSNDMDADSVLDPASLRIETHPASGTVAIQADGSVRYTPHAEFTGTDEFRYTVADDTGARSNMAIVTITVQTEPTLLVVGRTFEDLDADGPGLAGPGIAGYPIYLLDGQGALVATAHTQADDPITQEDETGWYHFPDLSPGTYVVAEKRVAGWWQSFPEDQGIQLAEPPVNPGLYVVTLSQSSDIEVLDFGNYRSGEAGYASIAGHVYVDVDNDGICDPQEMGLPNVPITLEGPVTRVVLTNATGYYRAEDLPAGMYTITETQPLVFQDGRDTIGTPSLGALENDRFVDVELLPEMAAEDYNFGEYGLKVEFIGKRILLASTPPASEYVADLQVEQGQSLVLVDTPAAGTLRAAASSAGEPPAIQLYDYHWRPVSLISRGGSLQASVAGGEAYLIYVDAQHPALVSAALDTAPAREPVYVYTNAQRSHDVNADGYVSPRDALLLINALNKAGSRQLIGVNLSAHYVDINHDNYLSPLDALLVINVLNHTGGEGEGEGEGGDLVQERALLEYLEEVDTSVPALTGLWDENCGRHARRHR